MIVRGTFASVMSMMSSALTEKRSALCTKAMMSSSGTFDFHMRMTSSTTLVARVLALRSAVASRANAGTAAAVRRTAMNAIAIRFTWTSGASFLQRMRSMSQVFPGKFERFTAIFSSNVDSVVRKMGRLAAVALLAATAAPARADVQWLPLDQAVVRAKAEGRIILLYVRTGRRGDEATAEGVAHLH